MSNLLAILVTLALSVGGVYCLGLAAARAVEWYEAKTGDPVALYLREQRRKRRERAQ